MEEEDAEAYGFGSFSELFDDRSQPAEAASTRILDAAAIQRFWMNETALQRFLEAAPNCYRYQHVAVKFDGVAIDGGLGSAYYVHADKPSAVVWIQAQQSDSNAHEKRRKQLKRLSAGAVDEATALSPSALMFHTQEMREIRATLIQNTVLGIDLKLEDGHHVELAFMPGPFANPSHRDELLKLLAEQIEPSVASKTPAEAIPLSAQNKQVALQTESSGVRTPSRTRTDVRALIRKYLSLAPTSEEAMELAKYVYDKTGYHLGPMTKTAPRFASDAAYRKKSMDELSSILDRMNSDWKQADIDRESHTRTQYKRDDDDLFHYTDSVTGESVSGHEYEQRYMRYLRPEPVDPILRLCISTASPSPAQEEDSNDRSISIDAVAVTLGFDISKSCLIDHAFVQNVRAELDTQTGISETTACQEIRESFRRHWDIVFPPGHKTKLAANIPMALFEPSSSLENDAKQDHLALIVPSIDSSSSSTVADEEMIATRTKRRRSFQGAESTSSATTTTTTRRKTRRQSIVNVVHFRSTPLPNASDIASKSSKDAMLGRSPRRPLTQEICQLCFSDSVVVTMEPCGHSVCDSCWRRLAQTPETDAGTAQCPWDRESVTRRRAN